MKLLCLLLLYSTLHATEFRVSANTPAFAQASIARALAEYEKHNATLPRIEFKWVTRDAPFIPGYACFAQRRKGFVVFLNAYGFEWPRAEVSLDLIYLHEIGHCLGWKHHEADSVMEEVGRTHLSQSDIARIREAESK